MARKGKHKKNKKQRPRKYNKKQFIEVFCTTCGMCDKKIDPSFCYMELYRHAQKQFINAVFKNLIDIVGYYKSLSRPTSTMSVEQFQNIFCVTGICTNGNASDGLACEKVDDCYDLFRSQMGALPGVKLVQKNAIREARVTGSTKRSRTYIKYKNKRKKRRYVANPYPTFFSSNNDKFKEAVKSILNGDNSIEQDKGEEPAGEHQTGADRSSKD